MSKLRIPKWIGTDEAGSHIIFPPDAVTQGFCALARRRSGKSVLAGVFEETLLSRKQSFVVLDPAGAHWGIKYRTDENGLPIGSSDFRVMVVGGEHGDVPLDLHGGKLLAQTVVSTDVSVVVDLSLTGVTERKRFVCDFADELYIRNSTPRCLILEEAQEFVPQSPRWEEQKAVLGSVSRLITGGGGRGLGFFLISQRPALVNKDVLSQIDNMFVMRLMGPQDLTAVTDWFEANVGDKERLKEIVNTLPQMKPGDAWLMSPDWMHEVTRLHVRMRATYHAGRTPKQGERPVNVKKFKLSKVVSDFKQALEVTQAERQAEIKDFEVAKARIRVLESELRTAKKAQPIAPPVKTLTVKPQIVKVKADQIREVVEQTIGPFYDWQEVIYKKYKEHAALVQKLGLGLANMIQSVDRILDGMDKLPELPQMPEPITTSKVKKALQTSLLPSAISDPASMGAGMLGKPLSIHKFQLPEIQSSKRIYDKAETDGDEKLPSGAVRLIQTLVSWHPEGMTKGTWMAHSGLKMKSGSVRNYLSLLRVKGLVEERAGKSGTVFHATSKALEEYLKDAPRPPGSTAEVLNMWRSKLGTGPMKILNCLVDLKGAPTTKQELQYTVGLTNSGSFRNYLSILRTANLIESQGHNVSAKRDSLFL